MALGVLGWTPDRFWNATFYELSCAYVGKARMKGWGPWARRPDGWSDIEIDEHLAEVEELKKRFPDKPRANGDARLTH